LLEGTPIDDMLRILTVAVSGYTALGPRVARRAAPAPSTEADDPVLAERTARTAMLSEREREVLELIAQGFTNREVARQLFLTEDTVKNYVSTILGTLGLRHRTEAALLWRAARRSDDL
jgi:DNA-binding NarL/FixJ family response regulator